MVVFQEKPVAAYQKYDENSLANLAHCGDALAEKYIINQYKRFVKVKARTYFLVGADQEDLIQEGMIGLYKAIRNYDSAKVSSFKVFAEICINRQMISAIKKATRQKNLPLNSYISLNQPVYHEDSNRALTLLETIDDSNGNDPMSLFLSQERFKELRNQLRKALSKLEHSVLKSFLEGKTYHEISSEVRKSEKSIDNALQRIKRKLEFIIKFN
ncbi:MAG: RNA polymerase sporulation sigma factor SigH [Candidatus Atribacteria bacterium]|nr:RNA polymerase sporulation sigma factor SigH [Candidatus Atribacteria bacterium]